MAVVSADYTTVAAALRRCLANGTNLDGVEKRLALDVVQHAANTLDAKGAATATAVDVAADAVEALLVTHLGVLVADGASPTQAHVDAAVAALATPRTTLIAAATAVAAAAAAGITNVTADDVLDGRDT